jgi:hypothetical protein
VRPIIWALICAASGAVQRECFTVRSDVAVDALRLFAAKPVPSTPQHASKNAIFPPNFFFFIN